MLMKPLLPSSRLSTWHHQRHKSKACGATLLRWVQRPSLCSLWRDDPAVVTIQTLHPQTSNAARSIWKMAFYTPEEVVMAWNKAEQAGYSTRLTPSRLVMRSPYNTAETHSEEASDKPASKSISVLLRDYIPLCARSTSDHSCLQPAELVLQHCTL